MRRGSWFYQEGSSLRPCDENLAVQLEEGYIKVKPWLNAMLQAASIPKSKPASIDATDLQKPPGTPEKPKEDPSIPVKFELQTQRLFGAYMNSVVTYQDGTTAWLLTDDFLSRMSSTVYQRFAGGGHLGGVKVVRGYSEANKAKEIKRDGDSPGARKLEGAADHPKRSATPRADSDSEIFDGEQLKRSVSAAQQEPRLVTLERQLSSFSDDPAKQEEERRQADEDEIKDDYKYADGQDQGREIEHLILVTHGIGQVSDLFSHLPII